MKTKLQIKWLLPLLLLNCDVDVCKIDKTEKNTCHTNGVPERRFHSILPGTF